VLACVLFAWNRNYFILLFIGVFLSSFGSTANPQMFALAREHADKTGREAVMFSSILRAQVSLAWVIGPPLAYALAMGFGFTVMYLCAAIAFVVCGAMVWLFLPSMRKEAGGGRSSGSAAHPSPRCAAAVQHLHADVGH
jgi:SET family sugar efflux transporter-like MFS transporter